jgi:hypothetical protein
MPVRLPRVEAILRTPIDQLTIEHIRAGRPAWLVVSLVPALPSCWRTLRLLRHSSPLIWRVLVPTWSPSLGDVHQAPGKRHAESEGR